MTNKERPSLGKTTDEILRAFKKADGDIVGRRIVEALLVGGPTYRIKPDGTFGIVVEEICLRDATEKELDELEEGIELGEVQIYSKKRQMFESSDFIVLHQATGTPLNPDSPAVRARQARWDRADLLAGKPTKPKPPVS